MPRPAHIPQKVWLAAKGVAVRFASDAEVTRMAEMIMRRMNGEIDQLNEDKVQWQPFLSYRQTRLIRDALMGHDTVIDDDVSCLFGLRSWFEHEARHSESNAP
jgi:hypothetical protein